MRAPDVGSFGSNLELSDSKLSCGSTTIAPASGSSMKWAWARTALFHGAPIARLCPLQLASAILVRTLLVPSYGSQLGWAVD